MFFKILKCFTVNSDERKVISEPKIDMQPKRSKTWQFLRRVSSIVGIKGWVTNDNIT